MASYQKLTLPNNLRSVTVQLPESQTSTVLVLVRAGSNYETKKQNGVSHFLEHMLFKGTQKRPSKKVIAELLDSVGASFNAFTSKEYTGYYVKVASGKIDLALDVVSDIYINSLLDAREVEKERRVILEELKMREDLPMIKTHEAFEELLYGSQPAGLPIGGTKESVSSITQQEIAKYYHLHYVAPATTVCLVAPQDHKDSLEKIKNYFAQIRDQGLAPGAPKTIDDQKKPQLLVKTKSTDQTHLALGFKAFPIEHPDRFCLELISLILGGGMSSRLFQKVREEEGLAYYVQSDMNLDTDCGYFAVKAGVANEKVGYAVESIINEISDLKKGNIEEKELQKVKDQFKGQTALSLESSSDWASFYGGQEILVNKVLTPQEMFNHINKVSPADIARVAKSVFVEEKLNLAIVGPVGKRQEKGFMKLLAID
ncbi:insulinase family protein [Candidatus Parcubacteria bacterium]|nr:MAG: insulinase family protein [Candidatus Parcubacteria bacterium]